MDPDSFVSTALHLVPCSTRKSAEARPGASCRSPGPSEAPVRPPSVAAATSGGETAAREAWSERARGITIPRGARHSAITCLSSGTHCSARASSPKVSVTTRSYLAAASSSPLSSSTSLSTARRETQLGRCGACAAKAAAAAVTRCSSRSTATISAGRLHDAAARAARRERRPAPAPTSRMRSGASRSVRRAARRGRAFSSAAAYASARSVSFIIRAHHAGSGFSSQVGGEKETSGISAPLLNAGPTKKRRPREDARQATAMSDPGATAVGGSAHAS
mmetsp:Transcript_4113/g.13303  ORF Transcript_4113/g.13303 Transcript_4113/m.13303 type:complete len:277 (-) Transcript_4113:584-1414(-)